jgi:hypothetical protein
MVLKQWWKEKSCNSWFIKLHHGKFNSVYTPTSRKVVRLIQDK